MKKSRKKRFVDEDLRYYRIKENKVMPKKIKEILKELDKEEKKKK